MIKDSCKGCMYHVEDSSLGWCLLYTQEPTECKRWQKPIVAKEKGRLWKTESKVRK